MKNNLTAPLALVAVLSFSFFGAFSQRGFNYYKDSLRVGSSKGRAYYYFKKAYYDHIWKWSKAGADSAEYYLKLALQEDPDYAAAWAFLGHVYQFETYNDVDWDRKLSLQKQCAEKALSYNPATGDAYSLMSDLKWHEHDTVQSLALLRKAIAQEPDNVGNYIFLAIRFTQMETQNDSAVFYLHRLLQYDPEYGQAFMKLGNVYLNAGRYDSSIYYYRKAIAHYQTIQPRDNRMMSGYYGIAEVFNKEQQYDSAVCYYKLFLQELEPSDMYIKESYIGKTYKALYNCYRQLSGNSLARYTTATEQVVREHNGDQKLALDQLWDLMDINEDTLSRKHIIPLARKLQQDNQADSFIVVGALIAECIALKNLKDYNTAVNLLSAYHNKHPNEPAVLFELGRLYIIENKINEGVLYLKRSRQHLNDFMPLSLFKSELLTADFENARHAKAFVELCK